MSIAEHYTREYYLSVNNHDDTVSDIIVRAEPTSIGYAWAFEEVPVNGICVMPDDSVDFIEPQIIEALGLPDAVLPDVDVADYVVRAIDYRLHQLVIERDAIVVSRQRSIKAGVYPADQQAQDAPMAKTDPDYSAFPINTEGDLYHEGQFGLSKREYFAAMALQGLCASQGAWEEFSPQKLAREASRYADLLIAMLNEEV